MPSRRLTTCSLIIASLALAGCRSGGKSFVSHDPSPLRQTASNQEASNDGGKSQLAVYQNDIVASKNESNDPLLLPEPKTTPEQKTAPEQKNVIEEIPAEITSSPLSLATNAPSLLNVIESVRNHFPMIQQAAASRVIASGEALSASGAFDHRLSGYSNVQPLDFYENNWHQWGVKRDTLWGGQVGAGYKLGRGSFEPWYSERETNDGGEFGFSLSAPIGRRDVRIDANRAELWRAQLERGRVEPFIRAQVIQAVRDGTQAYWQWVAASANLQIAQRVLQLGVDRIDFLSIEVKKGAKAEIDLVDNRRIIVSRRAKMIDARRKLEQSAVKLSLFLRTASGAPLLLGNELAPTEFPDVAAPDESLFTADVPFAVSNRPELAELTLLRRQLMVAYRQACNEIRPDVDGGVFLGQDVGNPTSSDDKSEFEIEATLTVSVPLERRKARGKVRQIRGKLAQLRAKTQFASDKIGVEVQAARAALVAAAERVQQTTEGVQLTERMQTAEQRLYEEGQSTLFNLNLREQQAAEAASALVASQLDFFLAMADYVAALGLDNASLDDVYMGSPQ